MATYDTIIIGGGPAGLSAAIYLGRFQRSVLILDKGNGRWDTAELNENYFGFPQGIHTRQLRELGLQQAEKFGALCKEESVIDVKRHSPENETRFDVQTSDHTYSSRSLILATGVRDHYDGLPQHHAFLGVSLFWCITCDGPKTANKKLVVIGNSDEAACTTMQLLNYTKDITVVANSPELKIPDKWQERLNKASVPVVCKAVKGLEGEKQHVQAVRLADDELIPAEIVFNEQGAQPNSELAVSVGVNVDTASYILTDSEQRTNIPFLYAAGDVTRLYSHQIVTAAHEGSMAAQAANYDLYAPDQKM